MKVGRTLVPQVVPTVFLPTEMGCRWQERVAGLGWGSPCGVQEAERRGHETAMPFTSSMIHVLQVVLLNFHQLPKLHHQPETELLTPPPETGLPRHGAMENAPY